MRRIDIPYLIMLATSHEPGRKAARRALARRGWLLLPNGVRWEGEALHKPLEAPQKPSATIILFPKREG